MGQYGKSGAYISFLPFSNSNDKFGMTIGRESNTYESLDGTVREILPVKNDLSISYGMEAALFLGAHFSFSLSLSGIASDFKSIILNW